ncbi:MAG: hypothetical protein HYT89_05145 [Candidatus Omnitrophica bacterium]|nr:hypothetical protein [Candidatus Omnitrophota bacterium]
METTSQGVKKRSKVMRWILVAVAIAYFWSARCQVWSDGGLLCRYNKWTGQMSYEPIKLPVERSGGL